MANPAPQDHDDDLLAPSLTAHDDAVGFEQPWNPTYLVIVGAFFGLIPMGVLLAENAKRLGKPAAYWPILVATVVGGILMMGAAVYAFMYGIPGLYEAGNKDHRRTFRLGMQVVAIVVGLVLAHQQRKRWDIHAGHGGVSAPLLKHAFGAILFAFALQFLVGVPFTMAMRGANPE